MRELSSSIEIEATPEEVWQVLTDFERYGDWNPMIRRIAGELRPGARLSFEGDVFAGRTLTIRPVLRTVDPPRELRWLGRMGLQGLFDGEHSFRIEPLAPGRVRFQQQERFTGVLVPLVLALIGKATLQGFEKANRALKQRVESGRTP